MTTTTHLKFIEWRNTDGLREDARQSISELNFLKDELQFLRDMISAHTLELIDGKTYEEAAKIGADLHTYSNRLQALLKELKVHSNNLKVLLDDVEEPNELKNYKDRHYRLMLEVINLQGDIKTTKRTIFSMLGTILKKSKQKKIS